MEDDRTMPADRPTGEPSSPRQAPGQASEVPPRSSGRKAAGARVNPQAHRPGSDEPQVPPAGRRAPAGQRRGRSEDSTSNAAPAEKTTPAKETTAAGKAAPVKKATAAKKTTPARKTTAAKKAALAGKATPAGTSGRKAQPEAAAGAAGSEPVVPAVSPAPGSAAGAEPAIPRTSDGSTATGVADATDTPPDATDTPPDATDTPPDATDTPADATDTPADATDTPADATDTPADATDAPPDEVAGPDAAGAAPGRSGRGALVAAMRTAPRCTPELLALEAVRRLGPRAGGHVGWLRDRYPGAPADRLAAMAAQRLVRQARGYGVVTGLAGPVGAVAGFGAVTWLQAQLVLEVAAANGLDPTNPRRAAELLTLLGVYADVDLAALALGHAATGPSLDVTDITVGRRRGGRLLPTLAAGAARVGAARVAGRLVPGAGALLAVVTGGSGVRRFAERAVRFYRLRRSGG